MINYLLRNNIFILLLFLSSITCYCQCTGCTVTNPSGGNFTFATNSVVCFTTGTTTMNDVTFQNNSKICIAAGATLIIQNNITSTSGNNVSFEIAGTLQFNQNPTINANLTINIANGGTMRSGTGGNNNFTFGGTANTLINNGIVDVGVLGFTPGSTNLVDNYGTYSITNNINVAGATTFRNFGTINIGASYNNNSTSSYLNCGILNAAVGYNLGGGTIKNTGTFNVGTGSIDMSTGSRLENYGIFYSKGTMNGSGSAVIYNEGLMKLTNWQPNGDTMKGPTSSSKKGYTYFQNQVSPNGAKIGPNLDLTRYNQYEPTMMKSGSQGESAIFSSAPTYVNASGTTTTAATANVTYDCAASGTCGAPVVTSIGICPNTDGSFPPVAVNDIFTINPGAVSAASVLANDLEQYNGAAATLSNVILTQLTTSSPDVTLNTATGLVQISTFAVAGNYTITYRICRTSLPSSCSTATVTITVSSSVCYKPAVTSGTVLSANIGFTTLAGSAPGGVWPAARKGASLVLQSKTKGLVINRLTTAQISAIPSANLREGMAVYNKTLDCLQINITGTPGDWKCFNTQACPD